MKKRLINLVLIVTVLCSIAGCKQKNEFEVGEKSNIEITKFDVTLSIKNNSLTRNGVTIVLTNNSADNIQYGDSYEIEIKKDGFWHKINVVVDFNMIAYILPPNEQIELNVNWKNTYGSLAKGEYRIIKSIDVIEKNDEFTSYYLSEEFQI